MGPVKQRPRTHPATNPGRAAERLCLIASTLVTLALFRVSLPPGERTGLEAASQTMVDKIVSVPRSAIGAQIGRCDAGELDAAKVALQQWLELG